MYQIRNFWFDNGANKILNVASIISTLPSSTIDLIKDNILKYWISKNSRNWKNFEFGAFIKLKVPSIKTIAIDETMQNINHYFNIWKKQFIVLAYWNLKNHEKIGIFCSTYFLKLISHR